MKRMHSHSTVGWLAIAIVCALMNIDQKAGIQSAFAQAVNNSAIDERTEELRAFQARLRSPDYVERMATFEAGIASSDPVVRQITVKEALLADNKDLQTFALRHWLSAHTALIVQLTMPDRPSEKLKVAYQRDLGDTMVLADLTITEKDEITAVLRRSGTRFLGQFIPGGVVLVGSGGHLVHCELNLNVADDTLLSGALRCQSLEPIPARVQIQ